MIHLVVTMQVKPDSRQAFLELFRKTQPAVLAEPGCRQYDLCADIAGGTQPPDPDCFTLIELWDNEAFLKNHMTTPHMQQYSKAVSPMRTAVAVRRMRPALALLP